MKREAGITPLKRAAETAVESANAGYPWSPTPAVRLSMLLHAAAVVTIVVQPALWPWALGAVAANHLLLTAAVFWPRGQVLGANLVRLPAAAAARKEVSVTFDDGPDPEVTPRVLDLLDRHQAKASFFCVGEKAAACPDIVKEIVRRGHSIENHSHRHSRAFAFYGLFRLKREVQSAQTIIAGITGRAPRFFRAPMGLRSPLLDPVLAKCGLRYVSWTRRGFDAMHRDPEKVLQRLAGGLAAGDILLLHDNRYLQTRDGTPVVLAVLPELLDRIQAKGLKSVTLAAASNGSSG
ncbi:MAG: polysaccharide deacetylase family protein [Burkholderiales bacterium]